MTHLVRTFDWSKTALGPISLWRPYLRTAVEIILQSPVPMILLCGPRGVMIYNDGYAVIAGKRHPAILGQEVVQGWPEIAGFNQNVLDTCLAGGTLTYRGQHLILNRNGISESAWFDIYYNPVYGERRHPEAVLAAVQETTAHVLTEQRRDCLEQALRESNKALQDASADLEQFAFSASHDLQEPLRMVSVYSQLLQRRLAGKLDEESQLLLRHCNDGARRLDSLLKGLLEYMRTSSESIAADAVNLSEIVSQVCTSLKISIQDSGATISVKPLPTLCLPPIHVQQIFQNLINNAIKYRSKKPPRITIQAMREEEHWTFSVADNGIGIDPAYKEQIFGLFKRLHGSGEYSGTGLGLAICKKLVERYEGRIWVESVLGGGAIFRFTLPLAENLPALSLSNEDAFASTETDLLTDTVRCS